MACFFYKPSSEQCLNSFNLMYFDLSTFSCTQVLWWASYAYYLCFILCWTDEMKESGITNCYIGILYILTANWFLECMDTCINPSTTFHFDFLLQLSSDIYISDAKFCCAIHCSLLECRERRSHFMWFCWHINCSCYREGILPLACSLAFIWISGNNREREKKK